MMEDVRAMRTLSNTGRHWWTASLTLAGRLPITIAYLSALVFVAVLVTGLGSHWQTTIVENASTNLHNLTDGRLVTLISSAFFTDSSPDWILLPLLAALMAAAELLGGSRRLLHTFVTGHVGATLIIAAVLLIGVHTSFISASISTAADVGVSYGAAAVLGALCAQIPSQWRMAWSVTWVVAAAAGVLFGHTFTNAGHLVALCIGLLIAHHTATEFTRPVTIRIRICLAVAALFGVGIFGGEVGPGWVVPTFAACAALIAVTATAISMRTRSPQQRRSLLPTA